METFAEKPQAKVVQKRLPVDPLRPTLRHAKPAQSYVDADEPVDDPDDRLPPDDLRLFGTGEDETGNSNHIDIVAEAIAALTENELEPVAPSMAMSTPQPEGKKRGRPPGRPSRSSLSASTPETVLKEPKKRGRPPGRLSRRTNVVNFEDNEDSTMADVDADNRREDANQREVSLAHEVDQAAPRGTVPAPAPVKRRGRPLGRKSMPTPIPNPEPDEVVLPVAPVQTSFMSMADRMAARGRKIKIRERSRGGIDSSPASARQTVDAPMANVEPSHPAAKQAQRELVDDDFKAPEAEASTSGTTSEADQQGQPRSIKRAGGPTIVRLDLSVDSGSASESESEFDDDEDEGIPARRFVAVRGRRGRGRGGWVSSRGRA
jgi:hypothetical protein